MTKNYQECYEYLSEQFSEVDGYAFYKEIFPDNEVSGVKSGRNRHERNISAAHAIKKAKRTGGYGKSRQDYREKIAVNGSVRSESPLKG